MKIEMQTPESYFRKKKEKKKCGYILEKKI